MPKDKVEATDEIIFESFSPTEGEPTEISSEKDLTSAATDDTLSSDNTATKRSSYTKVEVVQFALGSYEDANAPKWPKGEVRKVSKKEADRLLAIKRFSRPVFKLA